MRPALALALALALGGRVLAEDGGAAPAAPEPPALPSPVVAPPAAADVPPVLPPAPGEAPAPPEGIPGDVAPPPFSPPLVEEAPAPPPLPVYAVPPARTAVLDIRKTHNAPWRAGQQALRLDIDLAIVGQKGRFVGAVVDFFMQDGGPIRSILLPYANRDGQVSVWTRFVKIDLDAQYLRTSLCLPYRAFPCSPDVEGYGVQARVQLLRHDGPGTYVALASGTTTFQVHGGSGEPRVPDMNDYVGKEPRTLPTCAERLQRWRDRRNPLVDAEGAPRRTRMLWHPFCPVPGA